jgi:hypothetical protein
MTRFWNKIQKTNECWEWKGRLSKTGYGLFDIHNFPYAAHRFSYELNVGPIPKGLFVLHKCNNRKCVKPEHLYAGTQKDNMRDCINAGRFVRPTAHWEDLKATQFGEGSPVAKLKVEEVKQIRNQRRLGISYSEIGRQFGIHHTTVRDIVIKKIWKSVA